LNLEMNPPLRSTSVNAVHVLTARWTLQTDLSAMACVMMCARLFVMRKACELHCPNKELASLRPLTYGLTLAGAHEK